MNDIIYVEYKCKDNQNHIKVIPGEEISFTDTYMTDWLTVSFKDLKEALELSGYDLVKANIPPFIER